MHLSLRVPIYKLGMTYSSLLISGVRIRSRQDRRHFVTETWYQTLTLVVMSMAGV